MLKESIRKIAKKLGYDTGSNKPRPEISTENGFELYSYYRQDGTIDHEKYRQVQTEGNKRKLDYVWVLEENIAFLSHYITRAVDGVKFGICHGTRRGKEQEWFRKYLDCDVIGTEISDTAAQFPHTIQWDFHETKPERINAVDFIYSNSFDHSYDPEKCINSWMSCVKKHGICILEHTSGHERATRLDPFGAHITQMPYLILSWGKGKFFVADIIDAPAKSDALQYARYLIIRKN